jgi:hypothetical protein
MEAALHRCQTIRSQLLAELPPAPPAVVAPLLAHLAAADTELAGLTGEWRAPSPLDNLAFTPGEMRTALAEAAAARHDLEAAAVAAGQPAALRWAAAHDLAHLHQTRSWLAAARGNSVGAVLQSCRYERQQLLTVLDLDFLSPAAFERRPAAGGWSAREILIHLALWDRHDASIFAAVADGRQPPSDPFPPGQLDSWNREQVATRSWMSLTEAFHDLGAAHGEVLTQIGRLTPAQLASETVHHELGFRGHDRHHIPRLMELLA